MRGQSCSRYCRRGASIATKPRFRCVKERTQNVSMESQIFGICAKTHYTSSLIPREKKSIKSRISRVPDQRSVNVGDDSESSIVADNPGAW